MKLGRQPRIFDPRVPSHGMMKAMLKQRGIVRPPLKLKLDNAAILPPDMGMMLNDQLGDCLIGETLTVAPGLSRAYRVFYDGPIVTVVTRSGKRLTSTCNHQVMTNKGFIPAYLLQEGDYVVSTDFPQAVARGMGDNLNNTPARIEDVFKTQQRIALPTGIKRQMSRAVDFHGDARFFKSEIDVVNSNGFLQRRNMPAFCHPEREQSLIFASGSTVAFDGDSTALSHSRAVFPTTSSRMGLFSESALLFGRPSVGTNLTGFGSRPYLHASSSKGTVDVFPSDTELPCELIRRFPGEIKLDRIINVEHNKHSGYVYDLSTTPQWYIANGILTHNCTCAGLYHALQVWSRATTGSMLTEPDVVIEKLYEEAAGYVPGNPATDNGAIEQNVLAYAMNIGIPMQDGSRHKIASFVEVDPDHLDDICMVIQEFGLCYIGFSVPGGFMEAGPADTWDVSPRFGAIEGGHCVIVTGFDRTVPPYPSFNVVSWGTRQWKMSASFFHKYVDEAYALIDPMWIEADGDSPNRLTLSQLAALGNAMRV